MHFIFFLPDIPCFMMLEGVGGKYNDVGRGEELFYYYYASSIPNRSKNNELDAGRVGWGGELIYRTIVHFARWLGLNLLVFWSAPCPRPFVWGFLEAILLNTQPWITFSQSISLLIS